MQRRLVLLFSAEVAEITVGLDYYFYWYVC